MAVPVVNAVINFSTGPSFAQAMILDQGILGTNILGDSASIIVDVSNQINRIETKRGRNALIDQFQTGTLTLRIVDQNGDFNPQNPSSPYYTFLTPMKKVQITATYNSVTYPIFSGFITRTALQALQIATESEYGAIYVDADNNFVFQDRAVTAGSVGGTPTVFNDDGTGISYADAQWILNDVLIFNKATITRAGGSPQVALNQASIDKYFLHSYFLDNLLMQSDAVALDYAQAYVASRQETSIRVDNITLDLYTPNYNSGVIAALNLDFFDPITVSTTQPGGSILTKTLQIFGVAMNITPNSWRTTFTTLEPVIDAFILNNSIYGTLDYNVLSY